VKIPNKLIIRIKFVFRFVSNFFPTFHCFLIKSNSGDWLMVGPAWKMREIYMGLEKFSSVDFVNWFLVYWRENLPMKPQKGSNEKPIVIIDKVKPWMLKNTKLFLWTSITCRSIPIIRRWIVNISRLLIIQIFVLFSLFAQNKFGVSKLWQNVCDE
jgi:hypothetical protein